MSDKGSITLQSEIRLFIVIVVLVIVIYSLLFHMVCCWSFPIRLTVLLPVNRTTFEKIGYPVHAIGYCVRSYHPFSLNVRVMRMQTDSGDCSVHDQSFTCHLHTAK